MQRGCSHGPASLKAAGYRWGFGGLAGLSILSATLLSATVKQPDPDSMAAASLHRLNNEWSGEQVECPAGPGSFLTAESDSKREEKRQDGLTDSADLRWTDIYRKE